jgi:hypothetical protein
MKKNENLVKVTVPILNYEGNGNDFKEMYFLLPEGKYTVSKQEVLDAAKRFEEEEKTFPIYIGEWYQVTQVVESVKDEDWPILYSTMVRTNTFVGTTYGRQPLTLRRICVDEIVRL